ncbi:MAG: hypothetical protein HYZ54_11210 [Ignavibacteriae bacterium]|nr:hypothetical protein [Ignavibacteriota bacterium]
MLKVTKLPITETVKNVYSLYSMLHFKRLDHIQICIPKGKEQEAWDFYANIIGLTEIPKPKELFANGGLIRLVIG